MESKMIKGYSLSPQQKRLWRLDPDLQTYAVECVLRLDGALNLARLTAALQAIIDRHEILRTQLYSHPQQAFPLQVIEPAVRLELETMALGELAEAEAMARLLERLRSGAEA